MGYGRGRAAGWGRKEGRERPVGSLLPDSLKGALFQQERSKAMQWSCPDRLFKKEKRKRQGKKNRWSKGERGGAALTLPRVTLLLPVKQLITPPVGK